VDRAGALSGDGAAGPATAPPRARAALLAGPGELVVEPVTFEPPGPGEVQVRMAAAGVCHTDLHISNSPDGWGHPFPQLLGHEGAGVVEAVGSGVSGLEPGQAVAIGCRVPCGACALCRRGRPRRCRRSTPRAARCRRDRDGAPVTAPLGVGMFATRVVVDARAAVPMDPAVPLARAALLGCAVSTGVGSVLHSAAVWPGARVAVVGCGGIGLSAVQGARIANASQVIAVDVVEAKLAWARGLGATDTVLAGERDPVQAVRELTGGEGVDFAFEAVGLPACVEQCVGMLAYAGVATIIGVPQGDGRITLDLADRARGFFPVTATLTVSHGGDTLPVHDLPVFARLYLDGRLDLDGMVTHEVGLDEVATGFTLMTAGASIRTVVRLD
jgi:S-(hydroxymethyl)mycothiol dehydrogenase